MPHEFSLDKSTAAPVAPAPAATQTTGDTKPAEQKTAPATEPTKTTTDATATQATAAEPKKESPAEAPPATTGEDDDLGPPEGNRTWTYAAVKQERDKRRKAIEAHREAEKELAFLRGRLAALEKQGTQAPAGQQPKQPTKEELEQTYFTDPVAWTEKRVESIAQQLRNERYQERLETSRERAKEKWQDYDEVVAEFGTFLNTLPPQQADALANTIMREQRDPAAYVYNQVKVAREARKHGGSVEQYMAKVEAETRTRLEQEYKQRASVAAAGAVPKTMTGGGGPGLSAPAGAAPAQSQWERHWSAKKF